MKTLPRPRAAIVSHSQIVQASPSLEAYPWINVPFLLFDQCFRIFLLSFFSFYLTFLLKWYDKARRPLPSFQKLEAARWETGRPICPLSVKDRYRKCNCREDALWSVHSVGGVLHVLHTRCLTAWCELFKLHQTTSQWWVTRHLVTIILPFSCYGWENWGPQKWSDLIQGAQ